MIKNGSVTISIAILLFTIGCIPLSPSFLVEATPTPATLNIPGVVQIQPPRPLFVDGLVWSPDSTRLALSYSRVGVESSSLFQIYVLDIHSGQTSLLEESKEVSTLEMSRIVAWLPDGNIVFYAKRNGREGTWSMTEEGKAMLLSENAVSYFSPNGERIAFWKSEQGQNTSSITLYVRNLNDGIEEKVFHFDDKFVTAGPLEWSPDENHILFTFGFSEASMEDMLNKGLYLYSIDPRSKEVQNLTTVGQGSAAWWPPEKMSSYMSWSRDEKLITYAYWKVQGFSQNGLYVMQSDGICPMKLFGSGDKDIEGVSWSPDGRSIAFGWNHGVYLLDTAEVLGKDFSKYYSTCP